MTEDQKPAFVAALTELAALKPGAKLAKESYAAWWNAMRKSWTLEDFKAACEKLAREVEFMPNPFHFEQLCKQSRTTPGEAWTRALEVGRHGGRTSGDALIDKAVQAIVGYRAIGMSEIDKTHFLERRFCEHFESIQGAVEIREELPQIANAQSSQPKLNGPQRLRNALPAVGKILIS